VTGTNVQIMTTVSVNYVAGPYLQVEFGSNYDATTGVSQRCHDTHVLEIKDTNIPAPTNVRGHVKANGSPGFRCGPGRVFNTPRIEHHQDFHRLHHAYFGSEPSAPSRTSGSTYTAVIDMGPTSLSTNI